MSVQRYDTGWPEGRDDRYEAEFARLYDAYQARLYRFCYSRLRDRHEAEDVTQETLARAWRHRISFEEPPRSYAWLRVVAGNLCTDILRRRGRCETAPDIEPEAAESSEMPVLREADAELVRRAMERLNARHRAALDLRERGGQTYEQMAAASGTTVSSVESLLWRARQALRKELLVLAGPEGVLGALPIVGFLFRRSHNDRQRLARWVSQWASSPLAASSAALIGLAPAICAVTLGAPGPGSGRTVPPVTAAWSVAAPPGPGPSAPGPVPSVPTVPSQPVTVAVRPGGPAPVPGPALPPAAAVAPPPSPGPPHPRVVNPLTPTPADNQRDRAMPVSVGVANDTMGLDPAAAGQQVATIVGSLTSATGGR